MKKHYRAIWMEENSVFMIEQNLLPFEYKIFEAKTCAETCVAIKTMLTRGAGSLGIAAGYAMAQAALEFQNSQNYSKNIEKALFDIESTRPTAQNLFVVAKRVFNAAKISPQNALREAQQAADDDAFCSEKIAEFGNSLIRDNSKIATHCNAGWLAFVDLGTALAPIYLANKEKKNIFVYVDETRPRSQGARLTAWELSQENIPHTIIPDNATGYLMSTGKIDLMIVGADRIAKNGDTANKIGTLEKAVLAKTFNIPFYVAAPTSTIDFSCETGRNIPIEERSEDEVLYQTGTDENGILRKIRVASPNSSAFNPAFDVTFAQFITGFITEKGIFSPSEIKNLEKF